MRDDVDINKLLMKNMQCKETKSWSSEAGTTRSIDRAIVPSQHLPLALRAYSIQCPDTRICIHVLPDKQYMPAAIFRKSLFLSCAALLFSDLYSKSKISRPQLLIEPRFSAKIITKEYINDFYSFHYQLQLRFEQLRQYYFYDMIEWMISSNKDFIHRKTVNFQV